MTNEIIEPKLLLLPGGKGTGGGNWLVNLAVGTVFLIKMKVPTPQHNQPKLPEPFDLQFCCVETKTPKLRGMRLTIGDHTGSKEVWVDPVVFSNTFILVEVLDEGVPWEDNSPEKLDLDP